MVGRHCGDICVTAWKDVKLVTTVSIYHNSDTIESRSAGRNLVKSKVVQDYNRFMGGVDLKDQKLSMYLLETQKRYKVVHIH